MLGGAGTVIRTAVGFNMSSSNLSSAAPYVTQPQIDHTHVTVGGPIMSVSADTDLLLREAFLFKTSQELRMLSTVTLDCQVTKIVMNLGSQL